MGSRVQQQYFPKLCIISALPIYVTLIMLPENTLGSEAWLLVSQAQEEGLTRSLLARFQISHSSSFPNTVTHNLL